ncbi:MAG TPA: SPOR domain-containing protein [Cyclobacteriaceae bacterium]
MFSYSMFLTYLFLTGCSSQKGVTPTTHGSYSEDLSVVRPKIEAGTDTKVVETTGNNTRRQTTYVEPTINVNKQVDEVLDSINRMNLSQRYIDGFTIQIYSGAKREDALNIKRQITSNVPDVNAEVQYIQPNFRVKVGKYNERIEAQKDYMKVRQYFPNAIVIPERIAIN